MSDSTQPREADGAVGPAGKAADPADGAVRAVAPPLPVSPMEAAIDSDPPVGSAQISAAAAPARIRPDLDAGTRRLDEDATRVIKVDSVTLDEPPLSFVRDAATIEPGRSRTIGWYGKIPALGDFVTRRLPHGFTSPWDAWLQRGMLYASQQLGDDFDELYLTFPVWHFLFPPSLIDENGWRGVLSPSVDRVGRRFPLTIAESIEPAAFASEPLARTEDALRTLEDVALLALDRAPAEQIDARLLEVANAPASSMCVDANATSALPGTNFDLGALARPNQTGTWRFDGSLDQCLHTAALAMISQSLGRRVLWWTPTHPDAPGQLRIEAFPQRDELLLDLINA